MSGDVTSTTISGLAPSAATSNVAQSICRLTPRNTATSGPSGRTPGMFQSTRVSEITAAAGSSDSRDLNTSLR